VCGRAEIVTSHLLDPKLTLLTTGVKSLATEATYHPARLVCPVLEVLSFSGSFLFKTTLGFELKDSHLLDRYSGT
jgi:hypothetical protein